MSRTVNQNVKKTYYAEGGAIGAKLLVVPGTANNQVQLPGGAEPAYYVGITTSAADAAGDPIEVGVEGTFDLITNAGTAGAIAVGDWLSAQGTTGRARKKSATTKGAIGTAQEAATADADEVACLITRAPVGA